MYEKMLIATDGSDTAALAVRFGADLAKTVGAKVTVLTVGESSVAERAAEEIGDGLEVTPKAVEGDPADRIIDVAEETGADMIVIGNKGMTGTKRFLLGSVPNAVTHHAPCDVLVVKTT